MDMMEFTENVSACFEKDSAGCPDSFSECFERIKSNCSGQVYSSRYDNASAAWVVYCAILMFFMKAGFLYVEEAFSQNNPAFRRRVVLAKYIDIFAGTFGFWMFGYVISANTDAHILGEEQDYIFWFFRFTFASNTATILGGTLVGQHVQLRTIAIFIYSFIMTAFIHPGLARLFWSVTSSSPQGWTWSPYSYCNGTFTANREHSFTFLEEELGGFVFIDFAGSGLVHLCGGIGGFVLALFHKFEASDKLKQMRECGSCCKVLERGEEISNDSEYIMVGREKPEIANDNARTEQPEFTSRARKCKKSFDSFLEFMYPKGGGKEDVQSAALGILILWTTWFAFNAGSAESISGKAVHAAVGRIALVMCLACASAGTIQVIVSGLVQMYKKDETFNTNEIANVVLGALVAVTGCCPFIHPPFALIIGGVTVFVYHLGCWIEWSLKLHDGARVFPVHAMCGFWGVLCVGIFSRPCLIRELYDDLCFCVESTLPETIDNHGLLFGYQLAGALFIAVWSFVLCGIVFLTLFFIPIKIIFPCAFFCEDPTLKQGFVGNLLFTRIKEIGKFNNMARPELRELQTL